MLEGMPGLGRDRLAAEVAEIVGGPHVLAEPDLMAGYIVDWTGRWRGPARFVARPATTDEVAAVVAVCARHGSPLIPQGGNTGLVGGGVPGAAAGEGSGPGLPVVLSLGRLDGIEPIDTAARQVTVGAGVPLGGLQLAAEQTGLAFGVDLTARDTATIGGMVATNAGGVHVLRYGPMRAQVVGVEAVLAGGQVISRLQGLEKDNVGYDLSGLLVGSEGTLGVVTRARLRLVPRPRARVTALVGVAGTAAAVGLLANLDLPSLSAAEIVYADGVERVCQLTGLALPFPMPSPAYLLLECAGPADPTDELAVALASAGPVTDTAVATDSIGRAALWAYRERHAEMVAALAGAGAPHKLDVSVPLAHLAEFEANVRDRIGEVHPGAIAVLWGHVGDGNLHVNVVGPAPDDEAVDDAVLQLAASLGGSISAEHGIGRAKLRWLPLVRSPAEMAVLRSVKAALDPAGQLNPGVLVPG
jgi:FAD/FMN-containing dehydrogenase